MTLKPIRVGRFSLMGDGHSRALPTKGAAMSEDERMEGEEQEQQQQQEDESSPEGESGMLGTAAKGAAAGAAAGAAVGAAATAGREYLKSRGEDQSSEDDVSEQDEVSNQDEGDEEAGAAD